MTDIQAQAHLRSVRLWSSLRQSLTFVRTQGISTFAIAYVDLLGNTRLLWREHGAENKSLAKAERRAWAALKRYATAYNVDMSDVFSRHAALQSIYALNNAQSINDVSPAQGYWLSVDQHVVGCFGISGVPERHLDTCVSIVQEGYLLHSDAYTHVQLDHFQSSAFL